MNFIQTLFGGAGTSGAANASSAAAAVGDSGAKPAFLSEFVGQVGNKNTALGMAAEESDRVRQQAEQQTQQPQVDWLRLLMR